jgi:hypothetical protein
MKPAGRSRLTSAALNMIGCPQSTSIFLRTPFLSNKSRAKKTGASPGDMVLKAGVAAPWPSRWYNFRCSPTGYY